MSLDICKVASCNFVVWSSVNFLIINVKYDKEFWSARRARWIDIHRQLIVPELVLKNALNDKPPVEISYRYPRQEK